MGRARVTTPLCLAMYMNVHKEWDGACQLSPTKKLNACFKSIHVSKFHRFLGWINRSRAYSYNDECVTGLVLRILMYISIADIID